MPDAHCCRPLPGGLVRLAGTIAAVRHRSPDAGHGRPPSGRDGRSAGPGHGQSMTLRPYDLRDNGADFHKLADNDHLQGLDRLEFIRALADLYGDVNAIHPFREGNGRTQRAFLAPLAREAGYTISWQDMDQEENIAASVASFNANNDLLEQMLDALVRPA
ncbi:Fic family protein [Streptomyces sp. NPDC002787]